MTTEMAFLFGVTVGALTTLALAMIIAAFARRIDGGPMSGRSDGSEWAWLAFAIGSLFLGVWAVTGGCQW